MVEHISQQARKLTKHKSIKQIIYLPTKVKYENKQRVNPVLYYACA